MSSTFSLQDEKYHTELVLHYVDEAVRLMAAGEDDVASGQLGEVRTKLQDLLSSSSHYQPHPVLARLQGTNLHVETAAVFGRVCVGKTKFTSTCTVFTSHILEWWIQGFLVFDLLKSCIFVVIPGTETCYVVNL